VKVDSTVIAIDGPAASGKSTVARRVAQALDYLYVDSGALYRGVTWIGLENGIPGSDQEGILRQLGESDFSFFAEDGAVRFRVGDVAPSAELRTAQVNENVSPVAATEDVRRQVVAWLRDMTRFGNLVMEGRDIGTKVFPDTPFKFYLDASPEERARRRHGETAEPVSVAEVGASLKRRDAIDSGRKIDPLKVAKDADILDSTNMAIDEVVQHVLDGIASRTE